ncbi:glycosyltransferase [Cohnella laeviribosi]|uniref:glycosyltransferase n=1 Tax=Cohnella laeviribosi TaxID=380174 RepID=UPI00036F5723|nr:glycosyltransferase [Cohnella laeviribosi]
MNIAIDVLAILGPDSKNRGIGNYTTSQLKALFEIDRVNRYYLLNFYEDTCLKNLLHYSDNVSEHYFYLGKEGFLGRNPQFQLVFGDIVKKFIKAYDIDIFYFTSPFDHRIKYDMNWFSEINKVSTLYDIIPYVFKERYLSDKHFYKQYMELASNLKKNDKILAISQSAKDDLVNYLGEDPHKINVIYAGTDECYTRLDMPSSEVEALKATYKIKDSFIMCTGGDDDRKNIAGLIVAYSNLPKRLIEQFQLVIVCKLTPASVTRYTELANKHQVGDRVILTNFVPLDHLVKLYNLAHVVAFPSQYEGFGLPVVEAMACETPVLTSNNSSLGEIAEGVAVLVDPFNTKDITRGLIEILDNADLDDLRKKGLERVKKFNWKNVAEATLEAFRSLPKKNKNSRSTASKIAFFTPLPPLQSGISDYSVDILRRLSNYFTIDVFVDTGYTPVDLQNENIKIYEHTQFKARSKEYVDVVYQMGNSEYHAYMLEYIKNYPGTVVLHDFNLHGLIYFLSQKQKDNFQKYKEFLMEDYDSEFVERYVLDFREGRTHLKIYEMPCNGIVTNYAKKIIVHSDFAKKGVLERQVQRTVYKIHHYAKLKEKDTNKVEVRKRLNIAENRLILSAFGHIHETKRIIPIVKAFRILADKYEHIDLYLVGKPSPTIQEELEELLRDQQLNARVKVTGYIELDEFGSYIDVADICLNLRFPYNGESSGSLMRILSNGKCALINDIGSFSEIPDDCCVKLPSPERLQESEEINMIIEKLEMLIANPELVQTIGMNARNYAKKYLDLDIIVEQYVKVINESSSSSLTESMLEEVSQFLKNNGSVSTEEVYNLSSTLAYAKSQSL